MIEMANKEAWKGKGEKNTNVHDLGFEQHVTKKVATRF
jgi:hypothetical protein